MTGLHRSWLNKGIFSLTIVSAVAVVGAGGLAQAGQRPTNVPNPTSKTDCFNQGFQHFQFDNQGRCVSWVETHGHGNGYGGDNDNNGGHHGNGGGNNNGGDNGGGNQSANFWQSVSQIFSRFHF